MFPRAQREVPDDYRRVDGAPYGELALLRSDLLSVNLHAVVFAKVLGEPPDGRIILRVDAFVSEERNVRYLVSLIG